MLIYFQLGQQFLIEHYFFKNYTTVHNAVHWKFKYLAIVTNAEEEMFLGLAL